MRHFTARRLALAALVPAFLVLSVIPGCSNESEGERCGDSEGVANNDDCQSGLTCTLIPAGSNGVSVPVNRCCNPNHVTDSRCAITNGVSATNTSADAGSDADADASSTSAAGGASSTSEAGAAGAAGAAGGGM